MELENNSKFKIYLVIAIFIMIISLSAYVVASKIVKHETILDYDSVVTIEKERDYLLKNSKEYVEVSLTHDKVKRLYNMVNNTNVEEKLYLMKNSKFDWSNTASIVLSSLNNRFLTYENGKKYMNSTVFNSKYREFFGNFKIGIERGSNECDSVSFDISTNRYLLNEPCIDDDIEMKTFFKNITYNEHRGELSINKYYTFVKATTKIDFYTYYDGKDLFLDNDLKQIIVQDIQDEDISNYIFNMNTISYVFKKDANGNYYLSSVK